MYVYNQFSVTLSVKSEKHIQMRTSHFCKSHQKETVMLDTKHVVFLITV